MSDLQRLETVLDQITNSIIYAVRQDTHEILYFNAQAKKMAPQIERGRICQELWAETCKDCPLEKIGEKDRHVVQGYNSPFGGKVDFSATRITWGEDIPAFMVVIDPRRMTKEQQKSEFELQRTFAAISQVYEMIVSINLTQNTYSIAGAEGLRSKREIAPEGDFGRWVSYVKERIRPNFRENFTTMFQRERLLELYRAGDAGPYMECIEIVEDGTDRWVMLRVVWMDNPYDDDVLAVVLCRSINRAKLAEERLKEHEQLEQKRSHYRVAVESTQDIMFEYILAKDTFVAYEPQWKDGMKTISRVELSGFLSRMQEYGLVHPEYEQQFRDMLNGGVVGQFEVKMRSPTMDDFHWFRISGEAIYGDGEIVMMVGTLRDINEYKVMEERRRDLEQVCSFTVSRDYNLVATLDMKTGLYEISFTTLRAEVFGVSHSGVYQTALDTIAQYALYPADREEFSEKLSVHSLSSLLENEKGKEKRFYFRIRGNDGAYSWRCVRYVYLDQFSHKVLFTVQDVQEAREAKDKEMMATQMFVAAVRGLYDIIFEANLTTDALYELRYSDEGIIRHLVQKNLREILAERERSLIHPDHQERYRSCMDIDQMPRKLEEQPHIYFEVLRRSNSGAYHWVAIQIQRLVQDSDNYRVLIYMRDIDATRREDERTRQALRDALLLAENANHAKTDFISRMSHDIRTPMNAIIGMSAIARANLDDPEKISDCLNKIGISAKFLLSLINDILDMSKIESGKVRISQREFHLRNMVQDISAVIYPQTVEHGLAFDLQIDQSVPAVCIGDELRLNQILMNLLGNALKYTLQGRISFFVELAGTQDSRALLRFRVEDTGIGMSEEFQRKIFEPFEQEVQESGKVFEGTGLGMTITKNLVQLMGGKIWVESERDKGSRFTVELPLEIAKNSLECAAYTGEENLKTLRVLIADDDTIACEHLQTILNTFGIRAHCVSSGTDAVQEIQQARQDGKPYDVAFIDWRMPGIDGIEAVRQIRRDENAHTLLIVMSAYDWASIEYEARTGGVDEFVNKPVFPENIRWVLTKALREDPNSLRKQAEPEYQFNGEQILLVEDNEINLEIAKTLLEMKNLKVDAARNGLEAVELFRDSPPGYYRVILMDIRMPVMDGTTATREIRSMDKADAQTVPIVAMTANVFEKDEETAEQIGMNGYLIKPIDTKALYRSIHLLLYQGVEKLFS